MRPHQSGFAQRKESEPGGAHKDKHGDEAALHRALSRIGGFGVAPAFELQQTRRSDDETQPIDRAESHHKRPHRIRRDQARRAVVDRRDRHGCNQESRQIIAAGTD